MSFRRVEKWSNKVADIKAHIKLVPPSRLKPSNIVATHHNGIENKNTEIDRYVHRYISVQIYKDLFLGVYFYTCVTTCVKYRYACRHEHTYYRHAFLLRYINVLYFVHIHVYKYVKEFE